MSVKFSFWKALTQKQMIPVFIMGIASGLPLGLTGGTLQAWLKAENVSLATIGLASLLSTPYTFKFLWAPLMDRFTLLKLGRRRGWMLITQILLGLSIISLGFSNPSENLWMVGVWALFVSFFSASQDIVLDSWRREAYNGNEFVVANSVFISSYLFAFRLLSGAFALVLSDYLPWSTVYIIMSLFIFLGIVATLWVEEPEVEAPAPKTIKESVAEPFLDFFKKQGAWTVLIFILLYKLGENMASTMTIPYFLELGFSRSEVGATSKIVGWLGLFCGSFIAGNIMVKMRITSALFLFGIFQAVGTLSFAILTWTGKEISVFTAIIFIDNFLIQMGTVAFSTFMATMTTKKFTATQFALLTSLMAVPRTIASAPTGYLAQAVGWLNFFIICTLIAIPGLLLVLRLKKLLPEENS